MSDPIRFLNAIGQALSASSLYAEGHPARERAAISAYERLHELQRVNSRPSFSFLDHDVIYKKMMLRDLRDWEWGLRLVGAGIERLEFDERVPRHEFDNFLADILQQLGSGAASVTPERATNHPSIRFGAIGVRGEGSVAVEEAFQGASLSPSLAEESDSIRNIYRKIESGEDLDASEAESVVASLSVAMHGDSEIVMPLLQLKEFDQYTTTHSINVSVLAMALSEFAGLGASDVRAIGVAGLLHDVGMTRVPMEVVTKEGPPSEAEWALIRQHPVSGARMILASDPQLDLAAVVAYEHHILLNGGGYPVLHYERECHYASRLVQVCAVYDALRTRRYHREALPSENALRYVEDRAGKDFEPEVARSFTTMMRQWDRQIAAVDANTPIRLPRATPRSLAAIPSESARASGTSGYAGSF
ncbi:MAG: HD domain-containing protein [Gemmatimonadota bacterium]|nr:HD domain-containing protein [Gemmatimonadota bacterium]